MPPRQPSEFVPALHRGGGVPLERQLLQGYRTAILDGRLPPGTRLPSSRALAATLGINRNTVVNALEGLIAEGCLESVRGSGTFVAAGVQARLPTAHPVSSSRWLRQVPEPAVAPALPGLLEFRVCQPSTQDFPRAAWQAAWREALRGLPPDDYGAVAGEPGFREVLADYLRRARGLGCRAEDLLVTAGALQGVQLLAQATLGVGTRVAFEDPGYPLARQVLEQHGAETVSIPVDADGLRVDRLPTGDAAPALVYVTPSHQFPLGGRLSLARRQALLEWAEAHDALIVEDDYDSEFRFDVPPLPALASLDSRGRVVYLGTFSKTLSPALRVGYVVAGPALHARLTRLKTLSDYHTASLGQLALTHFLGTGAFERHLARMRRIYAAKRAALLEALSPLSDRVQVQGLEAGLNVFVACDPGLDLERTVVRCAERGVGVTSVRRYASDESPVHGLVLGYGGLRLEQIVQGAGILGDTLA